MRNQRTQHFIGRGCVRRLHVFGQVCVVTLVACTAGTEPSTDPRQVPTDPAAAGQVSGKVLTSGLVGPQSAERAEGVSEASESTWVTIGPVAGERIQPSRPLAGVVVELGIVRFERSGETAEGTTRTVLHPFVVADVWSGTGARVLDPGPAEPPGRFEVIARTTTNARGEFRFPQAPRGDMLMVRARPRAPYQETYCQSPFWLAREARKEVDVVVRGR
jgi:hypothetical protein